MAWVAAACVLGACGTAGSRVAPQAADNALGKPDAAEPTYADQANQDAPAPPDISDPIDATPVNGGTADLTPHDIAFAVDGFDASPETLNCLSAVDCKPANCRDAFCDAGICKFADKADGTNCPVVSPCATGGACLAGACTPTGQKACDDHNDCTGDFCDAKTGACVSEVKLATPCDDGNPCTKGDACGPDAACAAGPNACSGCAGIQDCAAYDDGNPCNGTLYCDTMQTPSVCAVLPQSVVVCDTTIATDCASAVCNPNTGLCAVVASPDGTACDDANPCTQGNTCAAGKCSFKVDLCQCQNTADCSPWDDKNACNGKLYCDTSIVPFVCKVAPNTLVTCPASTDSCMIQSCDPATGLCSNKPTATGTACSDGLAGTIGDICQAGKCVGGTDTMVCKADVDCLPLEDGDFCNGTLFCNKAQGKCQANPKTVVNCPSADDTACQKSQCQKKTGKCAAVATAEGKACDDGNVCTVGEVCTAGQCVASADTCSCKSTADCKAQEDGDKCNGSLYCDKASHQCVVNPQTVVACSAALDTQCTANTCQKTSGTCVMAPCYRRSKAASFRRIARHRQNLLGRAVAIGIPPRLCRLRTLRCLKVPV